jgi:hypothetical protein
MAYRRAFRPGDRVMSGGQVGVVERMRPMVTHLHTPKNEEVVVSSSTILAKRGHLLQLDGTVAWSDPAHYGGRWVRNAMEAGGSDANRGRGPDPKDCGSKPAPWFTAPARSSQVAAPAR